MKVTKYNKEKRSIPLRTAGSTIDKSIDRPSKVLFDQVKSLESNPPPTSIHHPIPPPTNSETNNRETSPKRDFTKFANSIVRDAIPGGLFRGASKNTYDVLYQRTRGAIMPTRSIKAVQGDILSWANVSHNTLRSHLKHLQIVGLIKIHYKLGDNEGAEYEVFLPEEIPLLLPPPTATDHPTTTIQELDSPSTHKLVIGGGGLLPVSIREINDPNTLLKTVEHEDDEFSTMKQVFVNATKKVSGKGSNKNQKRDWEKLAELIVMELEVAAARTGIISNVPAFLTEHLRRRLTIKNLNQSNSKKSINSSKSHFVGKTALDNEINEAVYEAETLDENSRETVLKTMINYIKKGQREFIMSLQGTYTPEDWGWLMENLEVEKNKE